MSAEGMQSLTERLQSDESLRSRLQAAPSQEEMIRIAADAGFDVTPADLPPPPSGELRDEELERVAGGVWIWDGTQWVPNK